MMDSELTSANSLQFTCCLMLLFLTTMTMASVSDGDPASPGAAAADGDPFYDYRGKEVKFGGGVPANVWVHSGTKWCGAGNIATSYDDLGSAFETDKCCRQHDYCKIYVRPNEEKYNFKNTFLYTLSHCECDNNFLNCLHASRDAQAKSVLYYFFYSLRMPCINLTPMNTCVRRSWWDKLVGGCSQYMEVETAVLMRLPQVDTTQELPAPPTPQLKFLTNR